MSVKKHNFIIRPYQQGDELKINAMFNEVFSQQRDISHWYWKYRDNPCGPYKISLAFTSDGILAAHYGGYPVQLWSRPSPDKPPTECIIYHLGDKMTRKEFRSAGFGKSALLSRTFMHFKATHVSPNNLFAYGFLTHHSLKFGLLFLDYIRVEPVCYRKINLDLLRKFKLSPLKRFTSSLLIEEVSEFDETWSKFFYNAAPHYEYLVKRDASYLRWRYLQRPDKKYLILAAKKGSEIAGWAVFYRDCNKIIWGDALFRPNDCLDCLKAVFEYLRRHSISDNADFIECWFPQRPHWWDNILNQTGFKMEVEPNNLHFSITFVKDKATIEELKEYFYYTIGDSDLF